MHTFAIYLSKKTKKQNKKKKKSLGREREERAASSVVIIKAVAETPNILTCSSGSQKKKAKEIQGWAPKYELLQLYCIFYSLGVRKIKNIKERSVCTTGFDIHYVNGAQHKKDIHS